MKYVCELGYDDHPDYDYLRKILTAALKKSGFTDDGKLVFTPGASGESPKGSPVKVVNILFNLSPVMPPGTRSWHSYI